ncbi:hypothetical protein [Bradyrhizobium sp.]|uniref:hypothetical protein n=1 Tax=Bradyrhizobium sp. TaxID=376 RepID=UPI00271B74DE|nr:hypothetical protein [Bradyrhizobium sp.]MDO9294830.1 hypothetical protein [Bradyrhizobium sp.]
MWGPIAKRVAKKVAEKFSARRVAEDFAADRIADEFFNDELSKPEAYVDRIKKEYQLPERADALLRYNSDPAYWKKLYGDDPLNSPNRPVPQEALPPPRGGSYRDAPSSSDPVYRGFPLLPDFHYQLQMPSPVDSFDTRFRKWDSIANPPASFDDRFGRWGSAPVADPRDSFNERFGNWGSVPVAGSVDTRSPVLRALAKYRRSETPDGLVMASAQGAFPAAVSFQPDIVSTGFVLGKFVENGVSPPAPTVPPSLPEPAAPNFANKESAFDRGSGNASGAPRPITYRVSSAFPNPPRDLGQPVNPPQPAPLGIFSGEPILPLPHSIWGLPDRSSPSPYDALSDFLAGLSRRNPAELPLDNDPRGSNRDERGWPWFLQGQR